MANQRAVQQQQTPVQGVSQGVLENKVQPVTENKQAKVIVVDDDMVCPICNKKVTGKKSFPKKV